MVRRKGSTSDCTRCLLQKLLNVDLAARRDSTLRELAASTATPSDGRQNLLKQRPHIGSASRSLRENQTRRIHSARHQRDRRRSCSSHLLRKELRKADVAIRKRLHNNLPAVLLRLRMQSGQGHKLGKLIERIVFLLAQQLALFDTLADLFRHTPELRRKKCGRLTEGTVVAPRHANCTNTANKLHSCSLPRLLGFPQQNRTDLPARADVRSATSRQIELVNLDQTQLVMLLRRQFTQAELLGFRARNIANRHRTVLKHNLICSLLGPGNLLRTYRRRRQINRAIVFAHVERDGRHLVALDKSCRENMLSGVLLHVVAAAFRINTAADPDARNRQLRWRFQVVKNPAIFRIRNFRYPQALGPFEREPPRVVNLPAAGWIERSFPQDDSRARLLSGGRCDLFDNRIEFVHFRTVVVKAPSHDEEIAMKLCQWRAGRPRPATPKLIGRGARS